MRAGQTGGYACSAYFKLSQMGEPGSACCC